MHDSSERRPGTGRPSLLSADQAPAQEDHSILSQLDGRTAPARRPAAPAQPSDGRGARIVLLVVGIASIATMAWLALGSVSQSPNVTMAATHAPAPVLAPARSVAPAPAAAAAAAASAAAASGAAAEVQKSAALIQDDLTAALDPLPIPAAGDGKGQSDALALAPPAATKTDKQDLASLLDAPAPSAAAKPGKPASAPGDALPKDKAKSKPAAERLARADKPRTATMPAKPKAPQKTAPKKPAPPVDTDVALLAALLAHTKTPAAGSAEDIFKRCATNATADEVHRCRVRVCQGSAKGAAECKSVRISKVSS